jgi:hypothetical protein
MRRTLGGRVRERRLTHLPGNLRLLVLALVVLSVVTMLTLALALAVGGDYTGPDFAIVRTALSVVIIAGAGLGVATVAATCARDDPDTVTKRRRRRGILTDGLLTGAALTILFALVAVDAPAFTGMGRAPEATVRALLWLALAAALLVAPRRPTPDPPLTAADSDRLRRLALPTVLLVALIVLMLLISQSLVAVLAFVLPGLTVVALAALVVVPAILVSATLAGLADTQAYGVRLSARIERQPRLVLLVLIAKLVLITLVWLLGRSRSPNGAVLNPTAAAWIGSLLVAGIVLILLGAERRLGVSTGDHPRVAWLSGWLVAVPLGIVAFLGLLLGVLPRLSQRPWTIIGLATLAVMAGLSRGAVDGWRRGVRWGAAMTLAVVLSLLAPRSVTLGLPSFLVDGSLINLGVLIVLLVTGLLVGIGVLLVLAVKTRQVRLGVYLLAVALWVAVLVTLSRVVPGTTGLNMDLPLTLLLLMAAVAWMRGVQNLVDGFEIVVTVVVLSVLIELPMILDMLPALAQRGLLLAALLTPAIASIWKHLSSLDPELAGRPALRALAVTCLGYATLAALVWTIGISGGDVINNLSTQVLNFLAVPIALLLVAAGSAARPMVSRWNDQQRLPAGLD